MHRLLITGITGFTGRYVAAAALRSGFEVHGITQSDTPTIDGCTLHLADLTRLEDIQNIIKDVAPQFVIHLAAVSFVAHSDVEDMYLTNVVATINLLDCLVAHCSQVKQVVVASSANVYGPVTALPIDETAAVNPINDYGVSKIAMEMAVKLRTNLLPVTIVRPFNYTGVGQSSKFLIPKLVEAFKDRRPFIELGNTYVSRDFSDVRDVAEVYLKLLRVESKGITVNVCSGVPSSLDGVLETLMRLTDHNIEVVTNPDFVRDNEIETLFGSSARLTGLVGDFRNYSLNDTLQWMLSD